MNTLIPLRRVALLLSSLVLLGLFACASATPTPKKDDTHTITISYNAANQKWSYEIEPLQSDPKNARVKRGDTINWQCKEGDWTVYFKGPTPLTNPADPCGGDQGYVSGTATAPAGAKVTAKVKKGDEFTYGVSVVLTGTTTKVTDDPRIIIEK